MICVASIRSLFLRAESVTGISSGNLGKHVKVCGRDLDVHPPGVSLPQGWRRFRAVGGKMMVDSSSSSSSFGPQPLSSSIGMTVNALPQNGQAEDESYGSSGAWQSEDGKLSCGYSSFKGKRATMEDFFDIKATKIDGQSVNLFGVFDGHGGSRAAEYLKNHLFENLIRHPKFLVDTKLAISETYMKTDADFLQSKSNASRDDGSTASTAILVGDHLYVANVGDSRAVISKAGKAVALSEDHKPNRTDERTRIENAGGVVIWTGTWRAGGVLAMSRAFGNRLLKQFVIAEPEIQEEEISKEVEFLVLASDGLWDVVPNEGAISIARMEEVPKAAARKLTEAAYSRGSADNITCIFVQFRHDKMEIY